MSLGQLADAVGRSSSSVRRWERDEVPPALTIMQALAEALSVDVEQLDALRPALVDEVSIAAREGDTASGSTIEQPLVEPSQEAFATQGVVPDRRLGLFGDLWNSVFAQKESWIGWVRGGLTTVFVLVMVYILFWAVGELYDALFDVWHSFGTG